MNAILSFLEKLTSRTWEIPEWLWELLAFVIVTPALVQTFLRLDNPFFA
jgi:hypothetical protein